MLSALDRLAFSKWVTLESHLPRMKPVKVLPIFTIKPNNTPLKKPLF